MSFKSVGQNAITPFPCARVGFAHESLIGCAAGSDVGSMARSRKTDVREQHADINRPETIKESGKVGGGVSSSRFLLHQNYSEFSAAFKEEEAHGLFHFPADADPGRVRVGGATSPDRELVVAFHVSVGARRRASRKICPRPAPASARDPATNYVRSRVALHLLFRPVSFFRSD